MTTTSRWLSLVALCALAGCGGSSNTSSSGGSGSTSNPPAGGEQQGHPQSMSNMDADAGASAMEPATQAAPTPPSEPVTVTAGTSTPIPANQHPHVAIAAPANNAVVRGNRVEVRLRVTDWPAPQDGRHIHLILDNEPYRRVDDPTRPVVLENLAEGTHVLRAFPGWHTHESVKTAGAFAVAVFHVGRRTDTLHFDPHAPLLTYSRPKGDYNGADAEHVLLDFYVSNVPNNALSATGHRVRYAIDGATTGEITSWVPHHIDHLRDGAHTIVLDLLGPNGEPVPGPFNHTERTINVNHSAPADGGHGAPTGSASAPAGSAAPPAAH